MIRIGLNNSGNLTIPAEIAWRVEKEMPTRIIPRPYWTSWPSEPANQGIIRLQKPPRYDSCALFEARDDPGEDQEIAPHFLPYCLAALDRLAISYELDIPNEGPTILPRWSPLAHNSYPLGRRLFRACVESYRFHDLCLEIVKEYTGQPIEIIARSRESAAQLFDDVRQQHTDCVMRSGSSLETTTDRITIDFQGGHARYGTHAKSIILIVEDSRFLWGNEMLWAIHENKSYREINAYLHSKLQLTPLEEYLHFSTFGANQWYLMGNGRCRRQVIVGWVHRISKDSVNTHDSRTSVGLDRLVSRSTALKRSVLGIIDALRHGDARALEALLPGLSKYISPSSKSLIVTRDASQSRELTKSPAIKNAPASIRVVPLSELKRHDINAWDVLIRADAGTGPIPCSTKEWAMPMDNPRPLIILDFDDSHHATLKQRTESRRASYRHLQWDHLDESDAKRTLRKAYQPDSACINLLNVYNKHSQRDLPVRS